MKTKIDELRGSLETAPFYYHGTLVDIFGFGVLISGKSGVGKSTVALALLEHGYQLVADDSVMIERRSTEIIGTSPPLLRCFLAQHSLGIIEVTQLFGETAYREQQAIRLIIELLTPQAITTINSDPMRGTRTTETILKVEVPKFRFSYTSAKDVAMLIVNAVRLEKLKNSGLNSVEKFILNQQNELMKS